MRFPLVPFSKSGEVQYINLEVLEERARHKLEKQAYDYYRSGSETQSTLQDNRAAFARYRMLPRIMVMRPALQFLYHKLNVATRHSLLNASPVLPGGRIAGQHILLHTGCVSTAVLCRHSLKTCCSRLPHLASYCLLVALACSLSTIDSP